MMNFFDGFQIASVAYFLLIIIGRVTYLRLGKNINPIAIGGGKKGLQLVVELIAFAGLLAWMSEVLLRAFHFGFRIFPSSLDAKLIDSLAARTAGVVVVSLGLLLFALAFISFGDSWRIGFDLKTPGSLVTGGVFSVSRNPIYLALNLWFMGIFLINGTLIFVIFALLAIAVMHWQILQEESYLLKLYGQPYESYCAQSSRYFGW